MKTAILYIFSSILLFLCLTEYSTANDTLPEYNLSVTILPTENLIKGTAKISIKDNEEATLSLGYLNIKNIKHHKLLLVLNKNKRICALKGKGTIEIEYEMKFPEISDNDNHDNPGKIGNVISENGISLSANWYPAIHTNAYYNLKATVPSGMTVISEAEVIQVTSTDREQEYSFIFPHPVEGITLNANRFVVTQDTTSNTDLYCYLLKDNKKLSTQYLEYAKKYINLYEKLLSPFPFKRFSIVENINPTGFSMPTYTLLGSKVMRLPFIIKTSFGHEVLHQWFGSSIYPDWEKGNWSEGITSYLADHYYKEKQNKGWHYRKNILQNYLSYVNNSNKFPLIKFRERTDKISSCIGYGKSAMIFHMLRNKLGDKLFFESLKLLLKENTFKKISWKDIQSVFEKKSQKSLEWFFNQWLHRDNIPSFNIKNAGVQYINGTPVIKFTIAQQTKPYKLDFKILITTASDAENKTISITKKTENFQIPVNDTPIKITFDPGYDVMRTLLPNEFPPTISRLFGEQSKVLIIDNNSDKYLELRNLFIAKGFNIKYSNESKDSEIISSSLILTNTEGKIYKRLFARAPNNLKTINAIITDGFVIDLIIHPMNSNCVIALVNAPTKKEVDLAVKKLFRYGQYSTLIFNKGRNLRKSTSPTQRGINIDLKHNVRGIIPSEAVSLDKIIKNICDKPIIYIGESHTNYEDHRVQLEIIRALFNNGKKFAIGMEMFQRPFQPSIDKYLLNKISEKEFLKATEYFIRWKFDYHLYREIVQFAKARGIPLIALNTDTKIIKKVSDGGLDALSEQERKRIPPGMDMSDQKYITRLKNVFNMHSHTSHKNFNNFYQSQILWDETMALTVTDFMTKNPEHQMVVLAGIGHFMYGSGIPRRVKRMNGKNYSILINSNISVLDKSIANYVLFPEPLTPPSSPLLGVIINPVNEGARMDKVYSGSIAHNAGFKQGDIITHINADKITSISDLKISLFDRKSGDTIKIKILRPGFLFGTNKMEFQITIP